MITFDLTDISIEEILAHEPDALALCTPLTTINSIPILPTRTCPVQPKLSWHWNMVGVGAEIGACRITVKDRSQVHAFSNGIVRLSPSDSIEIFCTLRQVTG